MGIILENALLVDLDPLRVEHGSLRIDGERIAERGPVSRERDDEAIDCGGAVVLPGLVNGHTHLYSALAVGMPAPPRNPRNFREILELIWWRLDVALDEESIETSARIGALDALRCGTTTLIDHHASPNCIAGSLDLIERGLASVGLRGVLCYETTDRHGRAGRDAGIEENRRYIGRRSLARNTRFAALAGAHASFTLGDEAMEALEWLVEEFGVGAHVHVAEDPCDEERCRAEYDITLMERLEKYNLLRHGTIVAHGTHLEDAAIATLSQWEAVLAHNPRSNMNNAVGYTPVGKFRCPVQLGTDGIGSDMLAEAKVAWFKSRDGHAGISPNDVIAMLANSARRASLSLGITLGKLEPNAAADVVLTDYIPSSPLTSDNLGGHLLFGLSSNNVTDVMVGGKWKLRGRQVLSVDEPAIRRTASETARKIWERMG